MMSVGYYVHKHSDTAFVLHQYVVNLIVIFSAFQLVTQASANVLYVSKARGHDGTNSCQNITSPCKTLNYVMKMTRGSDVIIMDPTNTVKIPYNTCANWKISGNVSFYSWNGSAIINCSGNGLNFNGNSTTLAFRGFTFIDTFLNAQDVSLTITNCSFGSFLQNAAYLYLIHISVNNPLQSLWIYITKTNFSEKNTAGVLNVVNHRSVPVFVELGNITIANNYLEKANYVIFIQGYVNFNFMDSEISKIKFCENISEPTLVYFYGCPDAVVHDDISNNRLYGTFSHAGRSQHRQFSNSEHESPVFNELPTISFSIKGLNVSYNHGGIVHAVFCTRANVSITDTTVLNNTNRWIVGGAVVVDTKYSRAVGRLDVLLKNSSFVSNMNKDTGSMVSIESVNVSVLVTNCTFSHNHGGAVYVSTMRESKVIVRNSHVHFSKSFAHIVSSHCGAQICVLFRYPDARTSSGKRQGSLDSPITQIGKLSKLWKDGLLQSKHAATLESKIDGPSSCTNTTGSLRTDGTPERSLRSNINTSRIHANIPDLKTADESADKNQALKSSKTRHDFNLERDTPLKMNVGNSLPLEHGGTFESGLLIEDCEFYNNTGSFSSSAALEVHSEPYISLVGGSISYVCLRRCVFIGNVAKNGAGAIYVAVNIAFNISNSTFKSNAGSMSGAIYFCGSTMVIYNCTLDDNSGGYAVYTQATGSVRLAKQGTALFQNSRIIQHNIVQTVSNMGTFHGSLAVSSDSFDNIVLSNSVLKYQWSPSLAKVIILEVAHTKRFVLKEGTSIECPWGYNIERRTVSESEQSFECTLCRLGSYSIDRGIYRYNGSHSVECLLCPYGARCTKDLEALPNFWGYKIQNNPPIVQFSRCPVGYCCQAEQGYEGCAPYNKCNFGRQGRLCGSCLPGFTETLFTPSCRKSEKCKDSWFWPIAVIFVLGFTLYLIIEPDIPGTLYRIITWFRTPAQDTELHSTSQSGLERIVFFYYQAIDILTVQSSNNIVWDNHFTQFTVGLFNFGIRLNREGFACPFPGLNPVSKHLFHTLGVFSVLFAIPLIFFLHKLLSICSPLRSPKSGVYLSAFLKSVFLGYTVLARNSLILLHCVTVEGVSCLFMNCNIECYAWWQKLIGTLILIYFLPFVLVLFFGTKKLYRKHISVVHLFLACLFPLPFLCYWFLNRRYLAREILADTDGRAAVTSVLFGSYRIPDHVTTGAIYWESVLIGRMLVLILAAVLIKDPFLSSLVLLLQCIINLSSHIYVLPFKRILDNRAETVSLFCLVLMAVFNLPFMAYLSEGVMPAGPISQVMDVFMWCQVVLVGFLPLIYVLLLFVAIFSQCARIIFFLTKVIRSAFACVAFPRCLDSNRLLEELQD